MSTPTAAHGALPEAGDLDEKIMRLALDNRLMRTIKVATDAQNLLDFGRACAALSPASPAPAVPVISAATRDALLDVVIKFIGTLTGMTPPPIEIAPPEVFAPFRTFVADVERIILATPAQQTQSDAVAGADFGDYVLVEQKRHGVPNEMYLHKVVGRLHSNSWVDVPVQAGSVARLHDETEEIFSVICCGVSEDKVIRHRVADCKRTTPATPPQQATPTMQDALAAGDGTLHGAIDHWQLDALRYRWLRAEAERDYVEFADRMFESDMDLDNSIDAARAALKEAP